MLAAVRPQVVAYCPQVPGLRPARFRGDGTWSSPQARTAVATRSGSQRSVSLGGPAFGPPAKPHPAERERAPMGLTPNRVVVQPVPGLRRHRRAVGRGYGGELLHAM